MPKARSSRSDSRGPYYVGINENANVRCSQTTQMPSHRECYSMATTGAIETITGQEGCIPAPEALRKSLD